MVGTPAREFEWLEVLGRGCSGVCRKVRDRNGLLMVVKQIDLSFVTEEEHNNAEREAHLLSSLSHPNIIRFYDDYIDDEMLHIVMEYAPLGTLKQHLNKLTAFMREPQVLWLFTNIVQGLAFLHEHKVMHRDLKSDNIFICEPFVPKLGDFGVAKRLNSAQPMAVSVVGTPLYLSPELCNGQPYNTKSDVWALGVLLYEMCARRAPFQAGNQGAVIKKILMGEYAPLPRTYSDEVTGMVSSCLAQDPNLRPSSQDLLGLLEHHQEPNGPANEPTSWPETGGVGEKKEGGEDG
eukprot:CAMPEP_0177698216 /NCGR_PEP_ID=MMETSP0484_2-20121128/4921_1 /TAXON_ID=354590 /ORGANISM="Rhodomonas lens, Strain RHODO" /LENGTH=291 /DNA_ID=CAMNT_0019209291 /DNA_START=212 /DNA_END=1083 /DNA_ORIENTATION=-